MYCNVSNGGPGFLNVMETLQGQQQLGKKGNLQLSHSAPQISWWVQEPKRALEQAMRRNAYCVHRSKNGPQSTGPLCGLTQVAGTIHRGGGQVEYILHTLPGTYCLRVRASYPCFGLSAVGGDTAPKQADHKLLRSLAVSTAVADATLYSIGAPWPPLLAPSCAVRRGVQGSAVRRATTSNHQCEVRMAQITIS